MAYEENFDADFNVKIKVVGVGGAGVTLSITWLKAE